MIELRFAFRQLIKSKSFTAIAVVTLALGIGLNTSMFSLMNLLLLQPIPYPDRDHLVQVHRTTPQSQTAGHCAADYLDLVEGTKDLMKVGAYRLWGFTLAQADRPPVNLNALRVSSEFFSILGMQPELGRIFTHDEDLPGNRVMIISHATWQAQFGGDPTVIGRTVRVDAEPTTIVGVMPAAFSSLFLWGPGDAFRPLALTNVEKADRNDTGLAVLGRYPNDTSLPQVNSRLKILGEKLAMHRPQANSQDSLRAVTLQSVASNPTNTQILFLLLGLSGFVLLIACANLANLQLARAVARTREFGIRAALGASRRRLLGPLLAESLLLSIVGGACGILVAVWSNDWISSRLSAQGIVFQLVLDTRVLVFTLVISIVTGLIFGIVPAWMMSRVDVNSTLKSGARGSTGDRVQHRFRHSLIIAQFALALVLLAGAGFFIRGLDRMLKRDAGWNTTHMLQGVLNLPQSRYAKPEQAYAFYTRLQDRLGALPGVEHVCVGWTLPVFQFLTSRNYVVDGHEAPPAGHEPMATVNGVTPSFLDTLEVKLISGRNFSATDTLTAPPVVIINESMARALFPNESPVGRRIGGLDPANRGWAEIVGVVSDLRFAVTLTTPATRFHVMRPLAQETWNYVTVSLRAQSPVALAEPMRQVIAELDPDLAVQQLNTVEQFISFGTSGLSLVNTILVGFALLGLFLAALGLYGVIARLVVQRTPEIGVRVALGAQSRDVVWLILGSGIRLTLIGTAVGLIGAYGLARILALIVPEMPVQDVPAVAVVTCLLVCVALLACWLPASRAAKVDPLTALRSE